VRRLVGLKGYVTNIPAALMPADEVMAKYHDLWRVEQPFRMSKSDLRARPIFHHTRDAIEAHLTTVFTAFAVSREAQNRTGLAIGNLVRQPRLRSATIAVNGAQQTFSREATPRCQAILDAAESAARARRRGPRARRDWAPGRCRLPSVRYRPRPSGSVTEATLPAAS
jgi:hypothetical protein